jgi:hypothetical protein
MINVTYQGDMLIASKVTGNKKVPKGKSTLEVDLSLQLWPVKRKYLSLLNLDLEQLANGDASFYNTSLEMEK